MRCISAIASLILFAVTADEEVAGQITVYVVPDNATAEEGDFYEFSCGVEPPGTEYARIRWGRVDGQPLPAGRYDYFDETRQYLTIDELVPSDSGGYRCQVVFPDSAILSAVGYLHVIPAPSPCESSPCQNGGLCSDADKEYTCNCPVRFTGKHCETAIDFCQSNPCGQNGGCVNTESRFECVCNPGFSGLQCEHNIDECLSRPCANGGQCIDKANNYACVCQVGYTGNDCGQDIDDCVSQPCLNGGSCIDLGVQRYICDCKAGYTGPNCAIDVDECASRPCQNNGRCVNGFRSYTCQCESGRTGKNCEQVVNSCEQLEPACFNNGVCLPQGSTFLCVCRPGFRGNRCDQVLPDSRENRSGDGTASPQAIDTATAAQITQQAVVTTVRATTAPPTTKPPPTVPAHPCHTEPCRNGGSCVDTGDDSYRCACAHGFGGKHCRRVLTGPCASHPCQGGGICRSRGRRFRCRCTPERYGRRCQYINCPIRGEFYSECALSCPPTCDDPRPVCNKPCKPACTCDSGLIYGDSSKKACVRPSQCPEPVVTPKNSFNQPGSSVAMTCSPRFIPLERATSIIWSRQDGQPLPHGRVQTFMRNSNFYIRDIKEEDRGVYQCTITIGHATQTTTAVVQVGVFKVEVTPAMTVINPGDTVTFFCQSNFDSEELTEVKWYRTDGKRLSRRARTTGLHLDIFSARSSDSAQYECMAKSSAGESVGKGVLLVGGSKCITHGTILDKHESKDFFSTETQRGVKPAADIVFLVDESASMIAEHAWLANVSLALDLALTTNGIGTDVANQFGLVGFAKDNPEDVTGRIVLMEDGEMMGQAEDFNRARLHLALNGRVEDMYNAIILALEKYPLRPGLACQIIGVTDEGRMAMSPDNFSDPYSRSFVLHRLKEKGCVLNVIVNQQFKSFEEDGIRAALGVSGNNDSAVEVPVGAFRIERGAGVALPKTGHGSTHQDYSTVAFETGGAAWDLNILRKGGPSAEAFTKAFVWLKEREISQQLCTRCFCDNPPNATCHPGCLGKEPGEVVIYSSAGRGGTMDALNEGALAEFVCEADGDPSPEIRWNIAGGDPLPDGSTVSQSGRRSVLHVPSISGRLCVECVAQNAEGEAKNIQCINHLAQCQLPGSRRLLHGDSARNYSTFRGEDIVAKPSSAVIVFVIDESGSMVEEHRWLNTTVKALEENLLRAGVGTQVGNRYALVGFAHPGAVRGRVVDVSRNGRHCGNASEIASVLDQLHIDGQLEDGYSAINVALKRVSCLQEEQESRACQIILATDEGRDRLDSGLNYRTILSELSRKDCILNVVVWERFFGREPQTTAKPVRALGIDRHSRAVIANGTGGDFQFLQDGYADTITGFENTHEAYVQLANSTGGGAWDLEMLRTEQYRDAFTRGFIAAKVEEIQQQIRSRCDECQCQNGSLVCQLVLGVSTVTRCSSPPVNRHLEIQVSTVEERSDTREGGHAIFACSAQTNQGGPVTLTWRSHPIQGVVVSDNNTLELQFSNLTTANTGRYVCQARNADGYVEGSVDLTVAGRDKKRRRK